MRKSTASLQRSIESLERRQHLAASFGPAQPIDKPGDLVFPTTTIAGDFDGDGDLDVASNSQAPRIAWYRNLGTGKFATAQTVAKDLGAGAPGPGSLATADINGDGRADLVYNCYEYPVMDSYAKSKVAWYEYLPSQNKWKEHLVSIGRIGGLQAAICADLDRDGDQDIISSNYRFEETIRVVWFENQSKGATWKAHTISDDGNIGEGSRALAVGDLNRDGWIDVVAGARFSGTVVAYTNPGPPQKATSNWKSTVLDSNMDEMTGVTIGDLNGDGALDVAAVTDNPYDEGYSSRCRVAWYQNDPKNPGHFTEAKIVAPVGALQRPWSIEAADLDLDGDQDLLVGCVNLVGWYENLGAGKFTGVQTIGTVADAFSRAADLNSDGQPDVLSAVAPSDRLAWYAGVPASAISGIVFKDLDQDGRRDADEPGLKGRTVYVDLDNDGRKDAGEPSAITDSKGSYAIRNLQPRKYNVRQVLPANWAQSTPTNADGFKVNLKEGQKFGRVIHGSFYILGSITGRVFNDLDHDGRCDANETWLKNRTLFADLDNDRKLDANEPFAITNRNGWYTIKNLLTGDYNIRQLLPGGWAQSMPAKGQGVKVHLLAGQDRSGLRHGAYLVI